MSKERRTVSLDRDVDDYLDRDGVNASELVNKLVKSHMTAGGDQEAMLELRKQQLESDVQELQSREETKRQELQQVRDRLETIDEEQRARIETAAERLDAQDLELRNQKVRYWADEADVSVDRLVERVREEWE